MTNDKQPMEWGEYVHSGPVQRRAFLRGVAATAALIPIGGIAAACASSGGDATSTTPPSTTQPANTGGGTSPTSGGGGGSAAPSSGGGGTGGDKDNPFGVAKGSKVDVVVFKGGYGVDYAKFAADIVKKGPTGADVVISDTTKISQTLQPRFVGGNPPDVFDNSGAGSIGINTIRDQCEDLNSVLDAPNYEGTKIRDTLFPNVTDPGTFDGKLVALNYAMTVYGWWYSASLFKANNWTMPTTWDEAYELGGKAKAQGKYLFVFGKEAATYYLTACIGSAIKEGGDEVRLSLGNLKPDCWSQKPVQDVFTALKKIIDAGYIQPGGAGTQFTQAQALWSSKQAAILYPSGSWIENEMKSQTKEGFEMTGAPDIALTASPKMGVDSTRITAGEPYMIPSKGANVAGGKEFLRAMLSKDAAVNFAKTNLAPTIVKDTVPADGFGSTALVSQSKIIAAAGDKAYNWTFIDLYGTNPQQLVVWNTFLSGGSDVATLTKGMQDITDKVAKDSSIKKVTVT